MQRPAVVRGLARRALVPALASAAVLAAGVALAAGVSALRSDERRRRRRSRSSCRRRSGRRRTSSPTSSSGASARLGPAGRRPREPAHRGDIPPVRRRRAAPRDHHHRGRPRHEVPLPRLLPPRGLPAEGDGAAPVRARAGPRGAAHDRRSRPRHLAAAAAGGGRDAADAGRCAPARARRRRRAASGRRVPGRAGPYRRRPRRGRGLLALVGIVLLAREVRRAVLVARDRKRRPPTRLERALGLVRRAERDGDERDRRLALDALASALDPRDRSLASATRNAMGAGRARRRRSAAARGRSRTHCWGRGVKSDPARRGGHVRARRCGGRDACDSASRPPSS